MEFSDLPRKLSNLWEIEPTERGKAIKLLSKIFNKILSNPQQQKFGDLNFQKISAKFRNCRPAFYLLYEAGFKETTDGTRLIWSYNSDNYALLKKVNDALQKKLKEPKIVKPTKKKVDNQPVEWEGTKYRRQIQQKMKQKESEKEAKRKLIKEKIAMQRKEQQIEQQRLLQKVTEKKQRQKEAAENFIKEQMVSGMNEIMQQMMKSLLPTNDNDAEQKSDDVVHEMPMHYKPSCSSGVYGSYVLKKINIDSGASEYDEELVNKLFVLGIATRSQLIAASQLADDHGDEFAVIEALQSLVE